MRKFQIRICPLCSKSLKKKEFKLDGSIQYTDYFCEEFYLTISNNTDDLLTLIETMDSDYTGPYTHMPHYSVKNVYGTYIQTTIVPPFLVETGENADDVTKVYKFPVHYDKYRGSSKKVMLEIPAIYPEDYLPGRLVEKLKTLILFS